MTTQHTPKPFELHVGDDYLQIQREDFGNLEMRYPNGHDKKLAALLVKSGNHHAELVEALKLVVRDYANEYGEELSLAKARAILAKVAS